MEVVQIYQCRELIKYLRLQQKYPTEVSINQLVREQIAEMDEEDVLWVKARLFEDEPKF